MFEKDLKNLILVFTNQRRFLGKKLAYPFEHFNRFDDYQKPVNNLKKVAKFSKLKNTYPIDEKIDRTKEINNF